MVVASPSNCVIVARRPTLLPELVAVALPVKTVRARILLPMLLPELVATALPPSNVTAAMLPVLVPELVAVALPPAVVCATTPPVSLPVLVAVALPPPSVCEVKRLAIPEFVVVAFWFAPAASLVNAVGAVPELVQLMSLGVVVQTNCDKAGELVNATTKDRIPIPAHVHRLRMKSPLRRLPIGGKATPPARKAQLA